MSSYKVSDTKNAKWVLNTGATDHMVCSDVYFSSNVRGIHVNISLPTGDSIIASKIGDIQFSDDLTLHNVLYAPKFTFNLVSARHLAA